MKKIKLFFILLIVIAAMPLTGSAAADVFDVPDNISVNDYSGVLSEQTKSYISGCNDALMSSTGSKVIFVTVPTTEGESIDEYASRLYNSWAVKNIGNGTSTFIVYATDDMQYWVIVSDNLKSALTSDIINEYLMEHTEPDFAAKNFDSAARKTYNAFNSWYTTTFRSDITVSTQTAAAKQSADIGKILGIAVKVLVSVLLIAIIVLIVFIFIKREIRLRKMARKRRSRRAQHFDYKDTKSDDINV